MKNYVEILNEELTQIFFSSKYFEVDAWNKMRLIMNDANVDRFTFNVASSFSVDAFDREDLLYLNYAMSKICDIVLFEAEKTISAQSYNELDVDELEELLDENKQCLNEDAFMPNKPIEFFKQKGKLIELKQLGNYHVYEKVCRELEIMP